jgi:hypothetical protein
MPLTELQLLRISVARVAQRIGVDGPPDTLPITRNTTYQELCTLAITRERGWNHLAELCALRADTLHLCQFSKRTG